MVLKWDSLDHFTPVLGPYKRHTPLHIGLLYPHVFFRSQVGKKNPWKIGRKEYHGLSYQHYEHPLHLPPSVFSVVVVVAGRGICVVAVVVADSGISGWGTFVVAAVDLHTSGENI